MTINAKADQVKRRATGGRLALSFMAGYSSAVAGYFVT